MPLFCCVVNCSNRGQRDKVRFFRIPSILASYKHQDELRGLAVLRRQKWLTAIKREDLTEEKIQYARVCSKHFITGEPAALKDSLNPDWIPSLHLGYSTISEENAIKQMERYNRKRARVDIDEAGPSGVSEAGPSGVSTAGPSSIPEEGPSERSEFSMVANASNELLSQKVQTDLTSQELTSRFVEMNHLRMTFDKMQGKTISSEVLKNDDNKTGFYTGLSYEAFTLVTDIVGPCVKSNMNTILSPSDQILLTLMKLRLNFPFKDLAYRFGISPTTASNYFKNVLGIMCLRFRSLVFWPDRETSLRTMPSCFKNSFQEQTTVIIDCFEIRIERPNDMLAAAQTWSNYKHGQTVKYLIGITPQGSICFISDGWGGRVSDKMITEQSLFVNHLMQGDIVIADRGFLIKEFVELFGATVKTPAFKKGRSQLHPIELENTRAIAHVRIHVERVIGLLRQKFKILNGVIPMTILGVKGEDPILDEIVVVCCSLVNLCSPIIPR